MAAWRALLAASVVGRACGVVLTKETWEEATAGKSVFVKFYAPWCGHCQSLAPTWDKLMEEYENDKNILIADVDCDGEGKEMCDEVGVQGFPTLKYGDPSALEDYEGERELEDLQKFVKESLGPVCGPGNLDACTAEKRKQIDDFLALPMDDLTEKISLGEEAIAEVESSLEAIVERLQSEYEAAQKKHDEDKKALKEKGLGLMKAVAAHRNRSESKTEL